MSQASQPAAAVLLETREGSIVTLAMNRPDRLNALDNSLSTALNDAITRIAADHTVHVVIQIQLGEARCGAVFERSKYFVDRRRETLEMKRCLKCEEWTFALHAAAAGF